MVSTNQDTLGPGLCPVGDKELAQNFKRGWFWLVLSADRHDVWETIKHQRSNCGSPHFTIPYLF